MTTVRRSGISDGRRFTTTQSVFTYTLIGCILYTSSGRRRILRVDYFRNAGTFENSYTRMVTCLTDKCFLVNYPCLLASFALEEES